MNSDPSLRVEPLSEPTDTPTEASVLSETLAEEFARLVKSYGSLDDDGEKDMAWNLIADFAIENSFKICLALDKTYPRTGPL